jgi:hypothetical protein
MRIHAGWPDETEVIASPPDASTITVRLRSEYLTVKDAEALVVRLQDAIATARQYNTEHGLPIDRPRLLWWRR